MKRIISITITTVIFLFFLPGINFTPGKQTTVVCSNHSIFLPIVEAQMAKPSANEHIEALVRKPADYPYDALIVEIFTDSVNVRQAGSRQIIRGVSVPSDINVNKLRLGMPVRLGQSQGKPYLADYFPQFDTEDIDYAGKGTAIPNPPHISVVALSDGWHVTWQPVTGADHYRVYRNDTPDETSPDEVGLTTQTSIIIPYESPYKYFAVKSVSGLNESELSAWMTDVTPPPAPTWTTHEFQVEGHFLRWSHPSIIDVESFTIYRNTSPSETGATEVLSTQELNCLIPYNSNGNWFGIKATDGAGNESDVVWTTEEYDPTPAVPTIIADMVEGGGFVCNWAAVAHATLYEIQGAEDSGGTNAATKWMGDTLWTPVIAETGISWFRGRAQGYDGTWSDWSSWGTDSNPPPQPSVLVTGDGISTATISIAANDTSHTSPGFSHYVLEQADDTDGTNAQTIDSHALYSAFPYIVAQGFGETWFFRLTPYDWAGNAGTPTAWIPALVNNTDTISDLFDNYRTEIQLATMESEQEAWQMYWGGIIFSSTYKKQGAVSLEITTAPTEEAGYAYLYWFNPKDLTLAGKSSMYDWITAWVYVPQATYNAVNNDDPVLSINFTPSTDPFSVAQWQSGWKKSELVVGWNHLARRKIDFVPTYGPDPTWDSIYHIIIVSYVPGQPIYVDDVKLIHYDPTIKWSHVPDPTVTQLATMELSESWYKDSYPYNNGTVEFDSINYKQGGSSLKLTQTSSYGSIGAKLDNPPSPPEAAEAKDTISFWLYASYAGPIDATLTISLREGATDWTVWYLYSYQGDFAVGWNFITLEVGDNYYGTSYPLTNLNLISFIYTGPQDTYILLDDLKFTHEPTDFAQNWVIEEGISAGPNKPYVLHQTTTVETPTEWGLIYRNDDGLKIHTGTVSVGLFMLEEGQSGLAFYIKNYGFDAWDMYAIEADSATDEIRLVKWVDGVRSVIASQTFSFAPNQTLWLGVDLRNYHVGGGELSVYTSLIEGNLFQTTNFLFSANDTSISSGGTVGLISYGQDAMFFNFVAGSPEHAKTADMAFALNGPILAGEKKRVRYNPDSNLFEHSDGQTWVPVAGTLVGEIREYLGITAPTGWLFCDGKTVGDGSSGADHTGASYQTIFEHIWNNTSNTYFPILDSSGSPTIRGASASADFNAHKRLPLPDRRGRTAIGLDNMGGSSANRVTAVAADSVGGTGGAETHTLIPAEMPAHTHPDNYYMEGGYNPLRPLHSYTNNASGNPVATNYNTGSTGGGGAHNNMQPWIALNFIIYAGV